jgi:hypothetical protein
MTRNFTAHNQPHGAVGDEQQTTPIISGIGRSPTMNAFHSLLNLRRPWMALLLGLSGFASTVAASEASAYAQDALSFHWNIDGEASWNSSQIAGTGFAGDPAMVRGNGSTEVAVIRTDGGIEFYWNDDGQAGWQFHQIAPAGTASVHAGPAMVRFANNFHQQGTLIAVTRADGGIEFYGNDDGGPGWQSHEIAPAGTADVYASPAMVRSPVGTEVAATRADGSLEHYWNVDSQTSWQSRQIAPAGSASGSPAMVRGNGSTEVAAIRADGSLEFYWNEDTKTFWQSHQIAPAGSASGSPAMVRGATTSTEVAVTRWDGGLEFYWNEDAQSFWQSHQIAPAGSASGSPAMVRSPGSTEVVTQ